MVAVLFGWLYTIIDTPIGLAISSVGLGWISVIIGMIALLLGIKSDIKMIEIENMIFLEAVDDIEVERKEFIQTLFPQIQKVFLDLNIETYVWRTKTCVIRATHPNREHINEKYQKMLSNYFITSLEVLYDVRDWAGLENNVQNNIIDSYKEVRNYPRDDKLHKRLLKVTSTMGRKKYELEEEFFNRM